jgi:O-antigen/teichoic acid export membrane protein
MNAAKRVALNTGFLYGRMAVTVFISLYTTRLVLVALGAKDFGIFNVVGGIILMLGFLNASMASATQRFMSFAQGKGDLHKLKQIFNVSVLLHILIGIVLFFLLQITGYVLFNKVLNISHDRLDAAKLIYQFMVVSTLFTIVSVPYDAAINARENMLLFAILGIVESVLKLVIALFIMHQVGDKLIVYGLLMAVLSILLFGVRALYCQHKYAECKLAIRSNYDHHLMKEMTSFAGWSLMGSSTSMISNYGQGMVLNIFFGTVLNAAQGVANQVSGQLGAFSYTMLRALNPTIAKSEGAGERELMIKAALVGSKVSFFLLVLLILPALVEMPYILSIWLKTVPPFTVVFCQLLLARDLIEQMFLTLSTSISAVGNIRKYQISGSILTFFPLVVTFILFKNGFPPYSMYIVFIVYSILFALNVLYFSNKIFQLSYRSFFNEVLFRCVLSFSISLCITLIPHVFIEQGFLRLVLVGITGVISFIVAFWFVGFTKMEKIQLFKAATSMFIIVLKGIRKINGKIFKFKKLALPVSDQDADSVSDSIFTLLNSGKPGMIARFGSTELNCVCNYIGILKHKNKVIPFIQGKAQPWWWEKSIIEKMNVFSGFFPTSIDKIEQFCQLMLRDIPKVDILGSWKEQEAYFQEELSSARKVNLELLNPYFSNVPWTKALAGKKVLVVHPFTDTITSQFKKRKLLFKDDLLPEFELKTVKAIQTIAGVKTEFNDWFEALEFMKAEIDKEDYDICLIGAGAYGFPLAAHVKDSGKIGFHMGGSLQLLFGIIGKRWETSDYNDIYNYAQLINEFWVRPGESEKPEGAIKVEGACYW